MRARFIAAAAVLFATSAFADDHLTIFVSDIGRQTAHTTTSQGGNPAVPVNHETTEWTGSVGIAFAHDWSQYWSTEGSIARDQRYITGTKFVSGVPVTGRQRISTTPADLMMQFHFPNDSRWNPYVGAGAHYVNAPDVATVNLSTLPDPNGNPTLVTAQTFENRLSAQIGIGTTLRITPSVGLQFDVKRLLRGNGTTYDPLTRLQFGVNWRL